VLPDTVVAYCESTIAFPILCEYVVGSENARRQPRRLVDHRDALVAELERQARSRRDHIGSPPTGRGTETTDPS
ncbi:MAG: hypothetical protein MK358_12635, partial [Vicinamibacterales bacterium]|nr:hypothetical protein [Vicinamibacterales bacterium]